MNVDEFTTKRMEEAHTISLKGRILDSNLDGIIVLLPCFCVHDSPDHPCRCTDIKILINKKDILGDVVRLDKKSCEGENLFRVSVERDANLLVEQTSSVKAENVLSLSKVNAFPKPPCPLPPFGGTGPTFPYPDPKDPNVVYFWPTVIKWAPSIIVGGATIVGGWLAGGGGRSCETKTESTTTTNPDGSTTTTTITTEKCS